jgi:acyl-coenzyme A synthetase/AMP-(fatty) acid ligase
VLTHCSSKPRTATDSKESRYYRTGDFGYFDDKGDLQFLGRSDDVIKRSGMKVPLQVINEAAMQSGLFQMAQCAFQEDKIYLLVVPKPDLKANLGLNRKSKAEFISSLTLNVVPAFYPDFIIALHSIPLNENGKVDMKSIVKSIENQSGLPSVNFRISSKVVEDIMERLWSQVLPSKVPLHVLRRNIFFDLVCLNTFKSN